MGFRQAAVLSSAGFLLGILFVCFAIDHRLLFTNFTEQDVADGFQFYSMFYNAPPAIKMLLHSMVGVGLIGLIGKLHKWDEAAVFFDGSSLAAYIFGIALYLTVTVPSLRTIVDPVSGVDTKEDQIEAMRVLCAGNVINVFLIIGILSFQAGQEYSRRVDEKELARALASEAATKVQPAVSIAEKKEQ